MKTGAAFPSNYLKADDLGKSKPIVTIRAVKMEDIGDDHKPVAYFQGKEKGLVLNITNANAITEIAGTDEMDDWDGVRLCLYATKTEFRGKRVPCIRIEEAPSGNGRVEAPPPKREPEPAYDAPDDDDVPF